jgi:hypothetical protein
VSSGFECRRNASHAIGNYGVRLTLAIGADEKHASPSVKRSHT